MMQHKFNDISRHVSLKGMVKLDRIAEEAERISRERESASKMRADSFSESGWIIAKVNYGYEKAVETAMIEAGIEACVIMRMGPERKRRYRVLPSKPTPVFNGIVFVFCAADAHAVQGVLSFEHVKNVIMTSDHAVKLKREMVLQFKDLADNGHYDHQRRSNCFRKGEKVKISSGPFIGYEVSIEAFAEAERGDAVVTINIFGKPTIFNMPLVMLEKV